MGELKPIFVYSEAFLRCAPWTPLTFRVQQNTIVKNKKGEEEFLCNAVKCLEAFGIPSDIDAVCAHLRHFKDSELARRVFRNLRHCKIPEPVDLISAFDLSVDVKENRTISYNTKKIFKRFLKAFLDLCLELTNGNSCHEEKLKFAFSDVFEGLTPTNFTLKVESSDTTKKRRDVERWIHIVHLPGCKDQQHCDTMVKHLAFLAPTKGWGMYIEGSGYRGDYKQWILPPAFTGFELDTDRHSSRNWTAMKAAQITLIEKPPLSTVDHFTDSKRSRENTNDDWEDEAPLAKIVSKTKRDSQRQGNLPIDLTGETPPPTPQTSEALDNFEPLGETPTGSQSETDEEQEVKHTVHDQGVHGGDQPNAVIVPFDPQQSTSGQDEQPETASQQKLVAVIRPTDVVSLQGLPENSWMAEGQGSSCISVPVILQLPDEVSETPTSQDDVRMEMTEALPTASTSSSSSASSAAGEAQEEQSVRQSSEDIGTSRETTADLETVNADIDNTDTAEIVSRPCSDPDPDLLRRAWGIERTEALTTASNSFSSSSSASFPAARTREEQSVRQSSEDISTARGTTARVARANLASAAADAAYADAAEFISQSCSGASVYETMNNSSRTIGAATSLPCTIHAPVQASDTKVFQSEVDIRPREECSLSSPSSSSGCISAINPEERKASCNVSDVTAENANNSNIGHKTVTTVTSQTVVAAAQVALQPGVDPVIAEMKNEILTQLISSPEVRRTAVCFLTEATRHIANQMNDTQ